MSAMANQCNHPLFVTWQHMVRRCRRPRNRDFPRYGGRGISVCARWKKFSVFAEDVIVSIGPRPPGYQFDRINNDGDYEPGNVRWVTPRENSNNRGNSVWLEIGGVRRPLSEWVELYGAAANTVRHRLSRGWDPLRALTQPPIPRSERAPRARGKAA